MKKITTLIVFVFIALTSISSFAQKSKKKKKKKEVVEEVVEVYEVEEVEEETVIEATEDSYSSNNSNRVLSQGYYNFKQKYSLSSINDEYDWFYDKNAGYSNKRYGIVNKKGEIILPNLFKKTYGGDDYNKIIYIDNNYGVFNLTDEKWSIPMQYYYLEDINGSFFTAKENGKYKIIDINNKPVIDKEWASVSKISSLNNYVIVSEKINEEKLYGIFSLLEKKLVVPCIYTSLRKFYSDNNNNFKVRSADTNKYNIIDINNKFQFKKWYDKINYLSKKNRYIVKNENLYGVLDDKENVIIPVEYLSIAEYAYSDGSHLSQDKKGKYGFMTIDGEVTLPFVYDKLTKRYGSDNLISRKDSKCGLVKINSGTPQEIVSCDYDDINNLKKFFVTKKRNKYGLLDSYGRTIVEPIYESIKVINTGSYGPKIIKVKHKGKYMLLNEQGRQINDEKYQDVDIILDKYKSSSYSKYFNFLKAKQKNKYKIIDKVGKTINPMTFDDIIGEYKNIFIVKAKNKFGLFSLIDNKMLLVPKYQMIIKTKNGYLGMNENKVDVLKYRRGKILVVSRN